MSDHLEDWALWMRAIGSSKSTIRTRLGGIQALCTHQGIDEPETVTPRQLAAWLADCEAPWTRYTYWQTARAWCSWLIEEGVREDDPLRRIPRPPIPRDAPRPVPMSVIRRILVDPPSARTRAYVVLGAFAGLRVHEIAKVRGDDVDRGAGWLYVTGKGGQRAAVPLHELVRELARGLPEEGWWFPGRVDGHVAGPSVSETIRKALRAVGSSRTAHALRHTFGTYVLRSSGDLRVAQEALRHRSVRSTQIYTQVSAADLQAAVRSLDWAAA